MGSGNNIFASCFATAVSLPLERVGVFSRLQSLLVLWIGPSEKREKGTATKRIAEIHGAIEQACEGLHFLREAKPYSPLAPRSVPSDILLSGE